MEEKEIVPELYKKGYDDGKKYTIFLACECVSKMIREWNWQHRFNEFYINEDKTVAMFRKAMED